MSAQMNELLFQKNLILGIGRLVTTEYRVLPSIRYSAKPSNRTEYRFSPTLLPIQGTATKIGDLMTIKWTRMKPRWNVIVPALNTGVSNCPSSKPMIYIA